MHIRAALGLSADAWDALTPCRLGPGALLISQSSELRRADLYVGTTDTLAGCTFKPARCLPGEVLVRPGATFLPVV